MIEVANIAKMQMLLKHKCWLNALVSIISIVPKGKCCIFVNESHSAKGETANVNKTQMLTKHKCLQNAIVTKMQMLPKLKCCQNINKDQPISSFVFLPAFFFYLILLNQVLINFHAMVWPKMLNFFKFIYLFILIFFILCFKWPEMA